MSDNKDTVKVIIEIPKKVFEARKIGEISPWVTVPILDAVQNGMPLDDVKAEIDKQEFAHHQGLTHWYMTPSEVKSVVLDILDNIDKAESEE